MRYFLLSLFSVIFTATTLAQETGSISGKATMEPGETTVPGAKITLYSGKDYFARTATTEEGKYVFKNIPFGKYQVVFTLPLQDTLRYDILNKCMHIELSIVLCLQ